MSPLENASKPLRTSSSFGWAMTPPFPGRQGEPTTSSSRPQGSSGTWLERHMASPHRARASRVDPNSRGRLRPIRHETIPSACPTPHNSGYSRAIMRAHTSPDLGISEPPLLPKLAVPLVEPVGLQNAGVGCDL